MAEIILVLLILGLLFNIVGICLVFALYLKIGRRVLLKSQKTLSSRYKNRIAQKVEKEAGLQIEALIKNYSEVLEKQSKVHFDSISGMTSKLSRELAEFIKQQEASISSESQYFVATNIQRMEKEMEEYRQARIKNLEKKISVTIGEVAKQVLGRAIDLKSHQQMVMEALEKAKAENLFSDERSK